MPKRKLSYVCFCSSCQATGPLGVDGEPLGLIMPMSKCIPHLGHVKAEREELKDSLPRNEPPPVTELSATIFAHVLTDNGPKLDSQQVNYGLCQTTSSTTMTSLPMTSLNPQLVTSQKLLDAWQAKWLLMIFPPQLNSWHYHWNIMSVLCLLLRRLFQNFPQLNAEKSNRSITHIPSGLITNLTMWNIVQHCVCRVFQMLPQTPT